MPFFLECCSMKIKPMEIEPLEPIDGYVDRKLLIGQCPVCKMPRYELREFDLINGKEVINRNKPKRLKHISEWVEKLESQKSVNCNKISKIKTGTKSAMAFIFGKSKETPLGTLHVGYDFNNTERKKFLVGLGI